MKGKHTPPGLGGKHFLPGKASRDAFQLTVWEKIAAWFWTDEGLREASETSSISS